MKKFFLFGYFITAVFFSGCAGNRKMVKTFSGAAGELIEATGVAPIVDNDVLNARKAALADAQKNAIELVVGVYVSAQTMVQKAVTIQSDILAKTEGYITQYDIIKEWKDEGFYKITIKAIVKLEEINKDLNKLGLLVKPQDAGNPRVSIVVSEIIDGTPADQTYGEVALSQALLDAQYPVVESTTLSDQEIDNALQGNAAFYRTLGEKLHVEILVIGTMNASRVEAEGLGGFISYRASADIKAIRGLDAKILITASEVQSAVDITPSIAAAKALKAVGSKTGTVIAEQLAAQLTKQALVLLHIEKVASLTDVRAMQQSLEKIMGVKNVQMRNYAQETADMDLYLSHNVTTQNIADHLLKMPGKHINIISINAYEISVSLSDTVK